jgi:DNA-binding response OmpR family regulator
VCLVDGKRHIRKFLRDAFEELDYSTCCCANNSELEASLESQFPDLSVLGPSAHGKEGFDMLRTLAAKEFHGKVLLLARKTRHTAP